MLTIIVPERELWDESKNEFIHINETALNMEHSLVSISKWEAKWKKPFLSEESKTNEETIDYIKCMTLTQNVKPIVYESLTEENINDIYKYINDPMTATTFSEDYFKKKPSKKETLTNEIIYYYMIAFQIPFECQKWHINKLLTLIRVCGVKNNPDEKKMSRNEILSRNKALNAARKRQHNTKG